MTEILCEYDPLSRGGDPADGRKVKGATIHWVDAGSCAEAEVRLYKAADGSKTWTGRLAAYDGGDVTLDCAGTERRFEKAAVAQVKVKLF